MGFRFNVAGLLRKLEEASPYPERRRRRKVAGSDAPAGPRLVRGLGLRRRRRHLPLLWILYLALSAAIVSLVVRTIVLPVIG